MLTGYSLLRQTLGKDAFHYEVAKQFNGPGEGKQLKEIKGLPRHNFSRQLSVL